MNVIVSASLISLMVVGSTVASTTVKTSKELKWSNHYAKAKDAARTANRPLLVVIENSKDPAQRFAAERLAANEKQRQLMRRFELCKVDVSTEYGKRVAQAYNADILPLSLIHI